MSFAENPYQSFGLPADQVDVDSRVDFIRKTYTHLTGAVLGFAFICAVLLQLQPVQQLCASFLHAPKMYFIAMLGLMGVSWVCSRMVSGSVSLSTQYAGLAIYTVAEAIFFLPMLWLAEHYAPGAITSAGVITVAVFGGLTLSVFMTRADFSFLRTALCIGSFAAIGVAICVGLFGDGGSANFGIFICGAFIILVAGYILYDTSNVLHHYPVGMHVAAALALFASLTMLFWYVLQLMLILSRRD